MRTEVMRMLDSLTASEKSEAISYLRLSVKTKGSSKPSDAVQDRGLQLWWDALAEEFAKVTNSRISLHGISPSMQSQVSEAYAETLKFIQQNHLDSEVGSRILGKSQVFSLLTNLMVGRARSISTFNQVPISLSMVLGASKSLPQIFDHAFPGYLESGIAAAVFPPSRR